MYTELYKNSRKQHIAPFDKIQ